MKTRDHKIRNVPGGQIANYSLHPFASFDQFLTFVSTSSGLRLAETRCYWLQYSRLCSAFFNLEHVCSVTKYVDMVTKKAKKEQKLSWSTCPKGTVSEDKPICTHYSLDRRWLRYMGHIIWPRKVPLVKIIAKLDTMKDKHNVLMTCFDW